MENEHINNFRNELTTKFPWAIKGTTEGSTRDCGSIHQAWYTLLKEWHNEGSEHNNNNNKSIFIAPWIQVTLFKGAVTTTTKIQLIKKSIIGLYK